MQVGKGNTCLIKLTKINYICKYVTDVKKLSFYIKIFLMQIKLKFLIITN